MERFPELITMKDQHAVKDLLTAIPFLCANLKAYGNKLETFFQGLINFGIFLCVTQVKIFGGLLDHLDRLFIHLRDASKDQRLDKISRLHLLEIIELRAGRWAIQDVISAYYKSKLAELSVQEFFFSTIFLIRHVKATRILFSFRMLLSASIRLRTSCNSQLTTRFTLIAWNLSRVLQCYYQEKL